MDRLLRSAVLCVALAMCIFAPAKPAAATDVVGVNNAANLLAPILPAVVNISVWKPASDSTAGANASGSAPSQRTESFGSGFLIDQSGIIVTNYHVVQDAEEISVVFSDNTHARGHVLAAEPVVDIALVKVDVGRPLPHLSFGDSDKLRIGDPVFAIGNPLGVGVSASAGIVSALNRDIMDSPYDEFIQTDAAINHGNSGGPLIDAAGEVIGVDTAIFSNVANGGSIGLGFAIPSDIAKMVTEKLLIYGHVQPGWIGVWLQDVNPELAQALGLPNSDGSIIAGIEPGSTGAKAGLQEGDVILRVGQLRAQDSRGLMRMIAGANIGASVPLDVWRDGHAQTINVVIGTMPRPAGDKMTMSANVASASRPASPNLGLNLAELSDTTRKQVGMQDGEPGVLVTAVQNDSEADEHGVVPGDVILKVQESTVSTPQQVQQQIDAARQQNRPFIAILLMAKGEQKWLSLPLHQS
jgi:serine protease Do